MKYKTYKTEDGHTKADCPLCEASEHIAILEEHEKCELCQIEDKMKYQELKDRHEKLEEDVINALINEVENSKTDSKHVQSKSLKVNIYDYKELVYLNELVFLDANGYHYSLYAECSLEDLLDILSKI